MERHSTEGHGGMPQPDEFISKEEEVAGLKEMIETSESSLASFPEHLVVDLELIAESDENLREPIEHMIEQCKRYTITVIEFKKLATDEDAIERFEEISETRGQTHDATMDAINVVVREMKKEFHDTDFVEEYNLKNPEQNRVHYAKFAILFTLKKLLLDSETSEE